MKEKIVLLIAIITSCIYFTSLYVRSTMQAETPVIPLPEVAQNTEFLQDEVNNINIYNQIAPSVVNVTSVKVNQTFFRKYDEPSGGSGFMWDKQGHIVTNYHVIQGSNKVFISLQGDNVQYPAKVVGLAPAKDIALLKIDAPKKLLKPIPLGTSDNLLVGQKTIALGNPFGLDNTLTTGIISALNRKINSTWNVEIHGIIQTDASINPGNSGGPLLNSSGKLIGVNTAIISKSGTSAGLGFAVPVDTVKRIVPQLIEHGKQILPTIGIEVEPRARLPQGLAIKTLTNENAMRAGLQGMSRDQFGRLYLGDILVKVDDYEINDINDLYHTLEKYKIGDEVTISFIRDNKLEKANLKLTANY